MKLQRLLALVPWVAARDGPTLAEVCARFGCTEDELVEDLDLLFMCGLYPYTPDVLIEADIADGRVWIRYAEYFSRPLRLTPARAWPCWQPGGRMLGVPGGRRRRARLPGARKLAAVLGVDADEAVEIELGPVSAATSRTLQPAARDHRQVEIELLLVRPRRADPRGSSTRTRSSRPPGSGTCRRLPRGRRRAALPRRPCARRPPPRHALRPRAAAHPPLSRLHPRPTIRRVMLELEPSGPLGGRAVPGGGGGGAGRRRVPGPVGGQRAGVARAPAAAARQRRPCRRGPPTWRRGACRLLARYPRETTLTCSGVDEDVLYPRVRP